MLDLKAVLYWIMIPYILMMNKKTFLITAALVFIVAILASTFVVTGMKPEMHKSFLLEIINVKIKK